MNLSKQNIKKIINEIVENNNFFLIELVMRGTNTSPVIEVFIDGEKNISADDCAVINREINSKIEKEGLINSNYRLDVSSPGTDRPLIYLKQFPKNINRTFEISYNQNNEIKKITGRLISVNNEELTFLTKEKTKNQQQVTINFNNIKKAKVIPSFS